MNVDHVEIHEVGPREGMQFEGMDDPGRVATSDKVRLVDALSGTGLRRIQVTSFVSPRAVPQMADADEVSKGIATRADVSYDAVYLNERGLERAAAAGIYEITGQVFLTASETFALQNQKRGLNEDLEVQRRLMAMYGERGLPIEFGTIMAAFGCNYEGDIPLGRVLELARLLHGLAGEAGYRLGEMQLADTMGWADPEQIKRTVGAVQDAWPECAVSLHLHDTRGTAMANVYAALQMGVTRFDTSIGGMGGCPFAKSVAGNVPTEDLVFICERMGIATGVDLAALVECVAIAEEAVGHPLPSRIGHAPFAV